MEKVDLIECPRDAMQGIKTFIPTARKVEYIQMLLNCNFHTLDLGSFVSPKAIPQMQDTKEVIRQLDFSRSNSKILTVVVNERGAQEAVQFDQIDCLGYPFSISETFQMRNTHKTIQESLAVLRSIYAISAAAKKELVVYLSMGFGNPYGEEWNLDLVNYWVSELVNIGVKVISLSDTVGSSNASIIESVYRFLIPKFPEITFGAHLHTTKSSWFEKLNAAYMSGCRRFDGAIQGFGGCPMAGDALVGNMPTEQMLSYFAQQKAVHSIETLGFESAHNRATMLFGEYV